MHQAGSGLTQRCIAQLHPDHNATHNEGGLQPPDSSGTSTAAVTQGAANAVHAVCAHPCTLAATLANPMGAVGQADSRAQQESGKGAASVRSGSVQQGAPNAVLLGSCGDDT
jgi:hypothetical protein